MRGDAGFTMVEMLVATALTMVVAGAALSLMDRARATFSAQPEVSDLQQRLRVAEATIAGDLLMAGAGLSSGRAAGPLAQLLAPLVPYRRGLVDDDAAGDGSFRADVISVLYVPATIAEAGVAQVIDAGTELVVDAWPNCGADRRDRLCGFVEGMRVLLGAPSGAYVLATVVSVEGVRLRLRRGGGMASWEDRPDAVIAEIAAHTFYLKREPSSETFQLMHYDGFSTDRPVVDHVVGLGFEYDGEPAPPRLLDDAPDDDTVGLRSTYGPMPPPVGRDDRADTWGPGENCVFTVVDGRQEPRLPRLSDGDGLVRLSPALFQDGPWCADADRATRYDADLLRVRRVHVSLRVEAASPSLRGRAGPLFARGGVSSSTERFAPDLSLPFDVVPRNLDAGR